MANRVYVAYRELYDLTKEKESRDTMLSTLRETAILFEKAGWPSRAAQMHWRAAQTLERERSNILASREFRDASRLFEAAAALIPQFSEFFMDYSRYMSAWALIDVARADTAVQGYESAANNYSMSSKLMKTTRRWSGASVYFEGWAKLQMGEAMSAGGKFAEAVRFFEEAQGEFSRTGETQDNQESDPPMISVEERLDSSRLSSIRKQYAEGRAALENARLLDLQESSRSSEQYELASLAFGTVANEVGPGVERDEFTSMSLLCQGWKLLKEGEIRHSGTSFAEAAQRFEDAARIGVTKTMVLTAGANSHYSEAMRLGLEFSHTGDVDFYTRAKKHMETARSEYSDAQLIRNAAWVEAAMSILDARLYIFKGEAAENPVERAKLYASAERSLGYALAIGDKAGYHSRMTSLEKELARVRGKATAAQDLAQMIVAPPVSTAGNLIQTRPTEEANGLAVFEGINLQGQIRHEREVEIGGMLDIQLDVFNSGNKSASLLRVEDIASNDLKLASVQEPYRANEADLETGGKTIQPLRIQSFKVSLKAEETGEKTLSPKLVYKDETGKIRIQPLSVTRVKILPQSTFEFHEPAAKAIFDMLVKEFMRDYMNRKLSPEQSGWRSRGEIGKASGVSRSSLYEGSGKYGSPLYELLSRGLIELRTFSGHRGRGGEASKLRILYSNETVRRYVDRKIMKSA
jgi:tetratricopeptide (TPR) repeat protein